MANDKLVLNISKINISPDSTRLKYGQDERGKQVDVTVIDNDNVTAYDLTGKNIIFSEVKDGDKIIIDDESTHYIRSTDNDKIGKFTYVFPDQTYQQSGEARFELTTDAEHIDSTTNFAISIVSSAQLKPDNTSYVSSLVALQTHYQSLINNAESSTQSLINSLTDEINQAITNGQKDVTNEVSTAQSQLTQVLNQEQDLINNWNTEFNKDKADFANLQTDWQNQSKQIWDNYTAQSSKIDSEAQSQRNDIQTKADQQLKSNGDANTSLTNQFNSDAQNEINKIETDKTAAIKTVTDARDKAIKDATDNLTAKLESMQDDYNNWKTTTVNDFQSELDKLSKELATDESSQTSLQQAIDAAQEAISKIKDVDFTVFAHKDDLDNYYTKAEVDNKVSALNQTITPVYVNSRDDVAAQDAYVVIVNDDN